MYAGHQWEQPRPGLPSISPGVAPGALQLREWRSPRSGVRHKRLREAKSSLTAIHGADTVGSNLFPESPYRTMSQSLVLYLVRHGEVHNPDGIIYGRIPGFGLSDRGREQLGASGRALAATSPLDGLYASPMQRAQESVAILSSVLSMDVTTDERLIETDVTGYQGKTFDSLPKPYITEEPVHEGLECASSIRRRLMDWVSDVRISGARRVAAVSHRDPIAIMVLHWQGRGLEELPGLDLPPGGVYEIELADGASAQVRQIDT